MRKFLSGFGFAWQGIAHALRTQVNLRVHLLITVVVVVLALLLRVSSVELALLLLCIGLVLSAELFNTALEALVDLASPDVHPLAKIAKDCAAAAVLVLAAMAVGVGLLVLGPPLLQMLGAVASAYRAS